MAGQVDAALETLEIQRFSGARAELVQGLGTVVALAVSRERSVDCKLMLAALIPTLRERLRHTTFIDRGHLGLFGNPGGATLLAIEPPASVTRAGGTRLAEFTMGRTVTAQSGCLACHRIGGQGNSRPGPDLTYVGSRLSARQIEQALISPTEPMPSFKHLPEPKLTAVVQFLSLLRH